MQETEKKEKRVGDGFFFQTNTIKYFFLCINTNLRFYIFWPLEYSVVVVPFVIYVYYFVVHIHTIQLKYTNKS